MNILSFILNADEITCEITLETEIIRKLEIIATKYNTTIDRLISLIVRVEHERDNDFNGLNGYFEF